VFTTASPAGREEISLCRELATALDQDLWKVRVMERTTLLFDGAFKKVHEALAADAGIVEELGIVAERRLLHQEVVLAMDSGNLPALVEPVQTLVDRLRTQECDDLKLTESELEHMTYQWWPTWRANLALVLASAGRVHDADATLRSLGSPEFDAIMPYEYWLQALSVIAIAAAWNYDGDGDRERVESLHGLLLPYHDRSIVPGSVAMNLGSVSTVLGVLASRLQRWPQALEHLRTGAAHNRAMGGLPAVARTELEIALLRRRQVESDNANGQLRRDAAEAAARCLEIAHELEMTPLISRATDVRAWAAAT
jgi:hypothetical protein